MPVPSIRLTLWLFAVFFLMTSVSRSSDEDPTPTLPQLIRQALWLVEVKELQWVGAPKEKKWVRPARVRLERVLLRNSSALQKTIESEKRTRTSTESGADISALKDIFKIEPGEVLVNISDEFKIKEDGYSGALLFFLGPVWLALDKEDREAAPFAVIRRSEIILGGARERKKAVLELISSQKDPSKSMGWARRYEKSSDPYLQLSALDLAASLMFSHDDALQILFENIPSRHGREIEERALSHLMFYNSRTRNGIGFFLARVAESPIERRSLKQSIVDHFVAIKEWATLQKWSQSSDDEVLQELAQKALKMRK